MGWIKKIRKERRIRKSLRNMRDKDEDLDLLGKAEKEKEKWEKEEKAGKHGTPRDPMAAGESMEGEEAKGYAKELLSFFQTKLGLGIPEEEFPRIVINGDCDGPAYVENDENGGPFNVIELRIKDQLNNGEDVGEEMAHFFRANLRPDHKEVLTDEFFGFLGRRLFYDKTLKDGESFWFPSGPPSVAGSFLGTKGQVVKRLKNLKKSALDTYEYYKAESNPNKKEEIRQKGIGLTDEREDILTHHRGYEFASKVDLSKIHNWKKLFSMPDQEVRYRFFRPDPDYSGL